MTTELQLSEEALKNRIAALLTDRTLPTMISEQIIAGFGRGDRLCLCCSSPIVQRQVEYELVDPRTGARIYFHFGCHRLWQMECVRRLSFVCDQDGERSEAIGVSDRDGIRFLQRDENGTG